MNQIKVLSGVRYHLHKMPIRKPNSDWLKMTWLRPQAGADKVAYAFVEMHAVSSHVHAATPFILHA